MKNANETNCGIYYFKNLINGKIYVGQSRNIKRRIVQHIHSALHEQYKVTHFYNALRKYGIDNFEWDILEYCDVNILSERESYWINELDTTNREKGYNIKFFDDTNRDVFPQETKDKISNALRNVPKSKSHIANMYTKFSKDYLPNEEVIAKRVETMKRKYKNEEIISYLKGKDAWNKGLESSIETREKQRLAKLGKKQSQAHINARFKNKADKIYQFNIKGEFVKLWESARHIQEQTNKYYLSPSIQACCNGNKLYYLDSIFRYAKDIDINNPTINLDELQIIIDSYKNSRMTKKRGSYTHNIISIRLNKDIV